MKDKRDETRRAQSRASVTIYRDTVTIFRYCPAGLPARFAPCCRVLEDRSVGADVPKIAIMRLVTPRPQAVLKRGRIGRVAPSGTRFLFPAMADRRKSGIMNMHRARTPSTGTTVCWRLFRSRPPGPELRRDRTAFSQAARTVSGTAITNASPPSSISPSLSLSLSPSLYLRLSCPLLQCCN